MSHEFRQKPNCTTFGTLLLFGLDVWLNNETVIRTQPLIQSFCLFIGLSIEMVAASCSPPLVWVSNTRAWSLNLNKTRALGPQEPRKRRSVHGAAGEIVCGYTRIYFTMLESGLYPEAP